MSNDAERELLEQAKAVLHDNDHGHYTMPAKGLYPHQWLWDSCFTAIGLRHLDVERAQVELLSLLRGQWRNGMIPMMIFNDAPQYRTDRNLWRSWISPYSPDDVVTAGITQPPMLAEAVVRVGEKLPLTERRAWYKQVYPHLLAHHQWLYTERAPHNEGLVLQVHPWETGLDNSPPWMHELHDHQLPAWIRGIEKTHLDSVISLFRRDTHYAPLNERFTTIEAMAMFDIQRRLRRKNYDIDRILNHSLFAIEDLAFNSILIRANTHLIDIAGSIRKDLPEELLVSMLKTNYALEELWDPYTSQYYPRNFVTHELIKEPSIATLLPLYSGIIKPERAGVLVRMLEKDQLFGPAYPVPSVPLESAYFNPKRYWQGPTWMNINWLIIDGLRRYGFHDHAAALKESSLEMMTKSGIAEYYDPQTGEPLGADNFSWTAALAIDLLKT
jgi:neutral trehalase